jgi:arylsulfatase A-like enzyme
MDRPNVLFIITDQQFAGTLSCTENPDLNTPAMDALAASGTRFEKAYCTQPLCSPCRASMFSGLMPSQAGVSENNCELNERARSHELGKLMQAAGYECAYAGKWHVPQSTLPEGHGFEAIAPAGHDETTAQACLDFLGGGRSKDKPFFLVASFNEPHGICQVGRSEMPPCGPIGDPPPPEQCPNLPANWGVPAFEPDVIRLEQRSTPWVYAPQWFTPEQWRQLRWSYYRLVEYADRQIGRLLGALDANGLRDETVVIFTSDHGDGHGAHQWNQKTILYEEMTRIPFIIRFPGETAAGRVDGEHLVSNGLDILPTICDYAGVEVPEDDLEGRSLRPLAAGRNVDDWRDAVFIETTLNVRRGKGRAVRTPRYKYIAYTWGRYREQLFDLENDPGEMQNLAVESRCAEVLDEHRRRLAGWIERVEPPHWARLRVPGYEGR